MAPALVASGAVANKRILKTNVRLVFIKQKGMTIKAGNVLE